jgi:alkylation response protein AidB-like acyl-CoA dehydrogenase
VGRSTLAGGMGRPGLVADPAHIFTEELQQAAVPLPLQFNCYMVGPVIATFGNEAQKKRFSRRRQTSTSGGARASLSRVRVRSCLAQDTRGARGRPYIVNGQKTWTTLGQYADWIFASCARTRM